MPAVPYSSVPSVVPSTSVPNDYQNIQASPDDFGAQIGRAEQGLGSTLKEAGAETSATALQYQNRANNIAADHAFNAHQQNVQYLLYGGDPDHPENPGYYGLHGQAAMDARPGVLQALEQSRVDSGASLNAAAALSFNEATRRLNMLSMSDVGRHYEQEFTRYAVETQTAGIDIKARAVANQYNDNDLFLHNLEDARRNADAKSALMGADPGTPQGKDIFANNRMQAEQTLYTSRAVAMGNADPAAAYKFLKDNVNAFDPITFHKLEGEFKAGAERAQVAAGVASVSGGGSSNSVAPIVNQTLPPEAQKFLPALSSGEGNYNSPAPTGDKSDTPISNNRYQFLSTTWQGAATKAGFNPAEKSPSVQDAVAWSHAGDVYTKNTGRNLQADIAQGGHAEQIATALNKTWTSLPGGAEAHMTMDQWKTRLGDATGGGSTFNTQTAQGMLKPGNVELWDRPVLHNPDGGYSTTSSMSIGTDGGETLIPTVINGKRLSTQDAIDHFKQTGENLGTFDTPENADTYATALHNAQAARYDSHGNPITATGAPAASPAHNPTPYGLEFQQMQTARQKAQQLFPDRPDLQRSMVEGVWQNIQQTNTLQAKYEAEQAKATRDAQEAAGQTVIKQIFTDPKSFDPAKLANDPNLTWEQKNSLFNVAQKHLGEVAGGKEAQTYGPGFWNAYQQVHSSDLSAKINDPSQLWARGGPGGDLTLSGIEKLTQEITSSRNPEGAAQGAMTKDYLAAAHVAISGHGMFGGQRDAVGEMNFARFVPLAFAEIEREKQAGMTPAQMMVKGGDLDKLVQQNTRSPAQMMKDMLASNNPDLPGTTPVAPAAPAGKLDLNTSEGIVSAYKSGHFGVGPAAYDRAATELMRRGFVKAPPAATPAPSAPTDER